MWRVGVRDDGEFASAGPASPIAAVEQRRLSTERANPPARLTGEMQRLLERVDVVESPAALSALVDRLLAGERTQVLSFLNQNGFNLAYENTDFRTALRAADVLLRDGVGIEVALKLIGRPPGENANGTDLIPLILRAAQGRRVAVFGTRDPWLSRAVAHLREDGIDVVAAQDGFAEPSVYLDALVTADPDVVVLAMGMPRQEVLAEQLRSVPGRCRLIINGGAILDFYADRFHRAPRVLQTLRLDWLFRLAQEPRRLAHRYLVGGALFAWRAAAVALAVSSLPRFMP